MGSQEKINLLLLKAEELNLQNTLEVSDRAVMDANDGQTTLLSFWNKKGSIIHEYGEGNALPPEIKKITELFLYIFKDEFEL
jgi:hypothetical protein